MRVATDIAARGLDIDSISHVINFEMADTADAYIHRIGRTGRAKRNGMAFTLITPDDNKLVRKIESIMQQKMNRETLPDFNYDVPMPDYPGRSTSKPKKHNKRRQHRQKS